MNKIASLLLLSGIVGNAASCQPSGNNNSPKPTGNQNAVVGGSCESCDLMYVDMPGQVLAVDSSKGWYENGQKLLVQGTVYKKDGKTVAPGIIIYYWQTDNKGYYSPGPGLAEKAKRHGHIRGWVKTDAQGRYQLYSIRPAPYPNANIPAHIHLLVKEPNIANEYYVDELLFDDDPLLTASERSRQPKRGGTAIVTVAKQGPLQVATHNIILGMNIPDYPE